MKTMSASARNLVETSRGSTDRQRSMQSQNPERCGSMSLFGRRCACCSASFAALWRIVLFRGWLYAK